MPVFLPEIYLHTNQLSVFHTQAHTQQVHQLKAMSLNIGVFLKKKTHVSTLWSTLHSLDEKTNMFYTKYTVYEGGPVL